jgi:hypothetical protein
MFYSALNSKLRLHDDRFTPDESERRLKLSAVTAFGRQWRFRFL